MKTYQHILIATNLSADSKKIADKAVSFAEKSAAKLSIVHVIEFNPLIYGNYEFAVPLDGDIEHSIQTQAANDLKIEGERLNIPNERQYLQAGATAENLVKLVNDIQADLLVLGSHEQHGLAILLGSTANALLHHMPCDVLAIHIPLSK